MATYAKAISKRSRRELLDTIFLMKKSNRNNEEFWRKQNLVEVYIKDLTQEFLPTGDDQIKFKHWKDYVANQPLAVSRIVELANKIIENNFKEFMYAPQKGASEPANFGQKIVVFFEHYRENMILDLKRLIQFVLWHHHYALDKDNGCECTLLSKNAEMTTVWNEKMLNGDTFVYYYYGKDDYLEDSDSDDEENKEKTPPPSPCKFGYEELYNNMLWNSFSNL